MVVELQRDEPGTGAGTFNCQAIDQKCWTIKLSMDSLPVCVYWTTYFLIEEIQSSTMHSNGELKIFS